MVKDKEKETLSEEKRLTISQGLKRFKMDMLKMMPFYGDVLMRLPVIEDDDIPTACTNGVRIKYSPVFFNELRDGQRNYVLMHEVLHVLLLHCIRRGSRRPELWNIACDHMVNAMLDSMAYDIRENKIPFERPETGCFNELYMRDHTAENVYAHLISENMDSDKILYFGHMVDKIPEDLKEDPDQDARAIELTVNRLLRNAIEKAGKGGKYFIPSQIRDLQIRRTKILPWNKLLFEYLTEQEDEESSYMTPERKYIHMDMIVPGSGKEDELGDIWAFIDSSGSIEKCDLEQFITQLNRISKEFRCCFNIAFWDDAVTMVYRNVRTTEQLLKCVPHSSGGTNINSIYTYIDKERLKPDVMLVLTDGYYGKLTEKPGELVKRTILVISEGGCDKGADNGIGKLATL